MPIPLGILAVAGAGAGGGTLAYDLISTTTLSSTATSVTFSGLGSYSSTYKHLQIRMVVRGASGTSGGYDTRLRFNGEITGYKAHRLQGNGTEVSSYTNSPFTDGISAGVYFGNTSTTSAFAPAIIDVLDPYSTTKNKTTRTFSGYHDASGQSQNRLVLDSGLWINASSVTSIYLAPDSGSWASGCRFSLYGIKG